MSGNRSIASAKNRRSMPERVNETPFKNDLSQPSANRNELPPKKLSQAERDEIIAKLKTEPITPFTIAKHQEMRLQNIEAQVELYNRAVFQDLNDRIQVLTLEVQKIKSLKKDNSMKVSLTEVKEESD